MTKKSKENVLWVRQVCKEKEVESCEASGGVQKSDLKMKDRNVINKLGKKSLIRDAAVVLCISVRILVPSIAEK